MNHSNDTTQQLTQRKTESLGAWRTSQTAAVQFLLAASDLGVTRNGGRWGARFAPQAILHCLEKMAAHSPPPSWTTHPVWTQRTENAAFPLAQAESAQMLASILHPKCLSVHLGGGHDHIYPLLKALEQAGAKRLSIINIDAHCDTRVDPLHHSGTPFRQFDQETTLPFDLIQLGIHPYANSPATLAPLKRGTMMTYSKDDLPSEGGEPMYQFLQQRVPRHPDAHTVVSLDSDALNAGLMEGVSAVNHDGMSLEQVRGIFRWAHDQSSPTRVTYGIYEYNPLYDNLSQKGARALAALIYEVICS